MLAAAGQKSRCLGEVRHRFPVGAIIEVSKVIDTFGGEGGRCWRVVVLLPKNSKEVTFADIPACWHWHPESWVTSFSPSKEYPIKFKPGFAVKLTPNK